MKVKRIISNIAASNIADPSHEAQMKYRYPKVRKATKRLLAAKLERLRLTPDHPLGDRRTSPPPSPPPFLSRPCLGGLTQALDPSGKFVGKDVNGATDSLVRWRCRHISRALLLAHERFPDQRCWEPGDSRGFRDANEMSRGSRRPLLTYLVSTRNLSFMR